MALELESQSVNTLLADPPAVASTEQPPATETPGAAPSGSAPESPQPTLTASQPTCANCGAPMDSGQDWCLQCGVGAPGSLDAGGPSWRSAAVILTATAVLVLGAAAAAYAALNKEGAPKARTAIVAVTPAPTAVTPTTPVTPTPTPTPTTPGAVTPTPKASETPPTSNPLLSSGSSQPPKIPLTAPTPKSSGTTTTPSKTNEPSGTTTPGTGESGSGTATEPKTAAIMLDPDAASTYNPYGYPESEFGDPSLAIDGDTSTAWTAQVNPAVAPKMAEGLVIDLKTARRISAVELITSTPGMSVQVYGANGSAPPTSITDPAWIQLSRYLVEKKHNDRIKLQSSTKAFRFITLWISKAPAASVGTAQDRVPPTHVAVNELELFPTAR
jgi:hypothetical protein